MKNYVECWHCENYEWFSACSNNLLAICKIKKECVLAGGRVCERFVLGKGIFTKREIPDYCINYNKK